MMTFIGIILTILGIVFFITELVSAIIKAIIFSQSGYSIWQSLSLILIGVSLIYFG